MSEFMTSADQKREFDLDMHAKKRRRGHHRALILVIAVLTALLAISVWLARRNPRHWRQHQVALGMTRPQDRRQLAETFEKNLRAAISHSNSADQSPESTGGDDVDHEVNRSGHNGDIRQLIIHVDQINAWLETKLPTWLSQNKPSLPLNVHGLMVAIDGGKLIVAFRVSSMELDKIVSIFLDLTIIGDPKQPQLQIDIARVMAGKLPIPVDALVKHLGKHNSSVAIDEFLQLLDVINGNKFDPIASVPGNHGHLIRLLDLDLTSDMLELEVSIEQLE